VFESRLLSRIFGPKRDEELHNLYSSSRIISVIKSRRMKLVRHVARTEERNAYKILVEKAEGKRPLGRSRRSWVDNIKMDLEEI
jgi:hypothetical protein